MGKMKELSTVLDEIVTCGETLVQGAEKLRDMMEIIDGLAECGKTLISSGRALKEYFSEPAEEPVKKKAPAKKKQEPEPEEEKPLEITITKENVRKVLSEVSQAGHRAEVIALLKKYGAGNITNLDAKDYAAVIAEAEELKNA